MKNISDFRSFIKILNESESSVSVPFDWDPKKAEEAIKRVMTRSGGSTKDKDSTGLSFKNINEVFGKSEYSLRFFIAQALKLIGKDMFPVNSYNSNLEDNRKKDSREGYFMTYYIGEAKQNEILDKISAEILKIIKPLVSLMSKDINKYIKTTSSSLPEVAKAKVELSKVKS